MKKGRKCIDRPVPPDLGAYSLNARPEGMDKETYKNLRKIQNKLLKLYLKNPGLFTAAKPKEDGITNKD